MIRRAVVDDFVGIVFLIGAAGVTRRARPRPRMECPGIAEPHEFPLRRAAGEKQQGEEREARSHRIALTHARSWGFKSSVEREEYFPAIFAMEFLVSLILTSSLVIIGGVDSCGSF